MEYLLSTSTLLDVIQASALLPNVSSCLQTYNQQQHVLNSELSPAPNVLKSQYYSTRLSFIKQINKVEY